MLSQKSIIDHASIFDKVTFNWQYIKNPSKEIFTKKSFLKLLCWLKARLSHTYTLPQLNSPSGQIMQF